MIYRVCITGTESTGKTDLAGKLAAHYKTVEVPDYSRLYVQKLDRKYNHSDVQQIAKEIIQQENKMLHFAHRVLFSDNDLINIKIWLQYYKWGVPKWLDEEILKRKADLYLLCDIDIAWVNDEQRENAHDREVLRDRFLNELKAIGANYKWVKGKGDARFQTAVDHIDALLHSH